MRLRRILLRYHPPGLCLEYVQKGLIKTKMLNLELPDETNLLGLADEIAKKEPLFSPGTRGQLLRSLRILKEMNATENSHQFKIWLFNDEKLDLLQEAMIELAKYGAYTEVMNPYLSLDIKMLFALDKIVSASFDKTACLWSSETGECHHTFWGHTAEVLTAQFNQQSTVVGLADEIAKKEPLFSPGTRGQLLRSLRILKEMNATENSHQFKIWLFNDEKLDLLQEAMIELAKYGAYTEVMNPYLSLDIKMLFALLILIIHMGQQLFVLEDNGMQFISLHFEATGNNIITANLKGSIAMWDTRTHMKVGEMTGHENEITNCLYNQEYNLVASSSIDGTAKLWELRTFSCLGTTTKISAEVLDIALDSKCLKLATASSNSSAQVWDIKSLEMVSEMNVI
ncbi:hypothetical protein J437_LFUL011032 [Ladona fulva]|uniref:Uncharacterized protein n=1 Tax=Ladona fulva TaxID=123851 RepID=A0A8K0P5E0_LADFU|nr:hypothetical protein J437_LFUL011032 [Ladona fulva]